MDGAMSTELTARGITFDQLDWIRANVAHPQAIGDIHSAYASSGAEIHIANTFANAPHVLSDFDLDSEFELLNRAGVEVCRNAVDKDAAGPYWIAGSISTFAKHHDRSNLPDLEQLEANCGIHAQLLANSGCDLIALEMLFDVDHTLAMLRGACRAGLPVSVGLLAESDDRGSVVVKDKVRSHSADRPLFFADALETIIDQIPADSTVIFSAMHSFFEDTGPALKILKDKWDGPVAAYPNIGKFRAPGGWDVSSAPSPVEFADACESWVSMGANIVGGCCGVGPAYIEELSSRTLFSQTASTRATPTLWR